MPKSIIDIEVNDEAFKRFKDLYDKYQGTLTEGAGKWEESREQIDGMAAAFVAITATLVAHTELLEKQKKIREEQQKAEREDERREKAGEDRRKRAIQQTKQIATNVKDTAVSLAKWTSLGGATGVAADFLGMWGLDKLVGGIANERRTAGGFGVTTGERQAMAVNLQRYFDVNSLLENIAETQADVTRRWAFTGLGVNPNGKDPAQLSAEVANAAIRIFNQGHGNEQWAQAHGLLNFFSMDELRRMSAHPEEVKAAEEQARKDAAPGGRFYLSDQVGKKWQDFLRDLDSASLALQDKLVDKLTVLEKPLGEVVSKFTDLALVVLGNGLEKFSQYISDGQFQAGFKVFIDDVVAIAQKIDDGLKLLGWVPESKTDPGAPGGNVPNANAVAGPAPPFGQVPWSAATGFLDPLVTAARHHGQWWLTDQYEKNAQDYAARNFMKWGWSGANAAGIIANDTAESDMNPFAKGDWVDAQGRPAKPYSKGAHYLSYGIGQWKAGTGRREQFAKLFGHTMESITDPSEALKEELEFQNWELQNTYKKAGDDLRRDRNNRFQSGYDVAMDYEQMKAGKAAAIERGKAAVNLRVDILNGTGASVNTSMSNASQ